MKGGRNCFLRSCREGATKPCSNVTSRIAAVSATTASDAAARQRAQTCGKLRACLQHAWDITGGHVSITSPKGHIWNNLKLLIPPLQGLLIASQSRRQESLPVLGTSHQKHTASPSVVLRRGCGSGEAQNLCARPLTRCRVELLWCFDRFTVAV